MKMDMRKTIAIAAAGLALAGCVTGNGSKGSQDSAVGSWGLRLGYPEMSAGHMIVSCGQDGKAKAYVLWRWASPEWMKNVVLDGDVITFDHPSGFRVVGKVNGDTLTGMAYKKDGKVETTVDGWRNPPIEPASTKDAVLGAPIDLLKDGLDGWVAMDPKAKFGWKFKDGVLSNQLGQLPNGAWSCGGTNLKTKREDFLDFNLEYDVRVPKGSNSGVYLRGRYECQVVDSYKHRPDCHNMAALYGRVTPRVAAEKKPGEWQHVSVTLYKRHITVVLNGKTIIEDAPVEGVTGGAIDANEFVPGPLYLQGDHSDADYRHMILRKAK